MALHDNLTGLANHRYLHMGAERRYGQRLIGWNGTPGCGAGLRLGLVDGAIDATHPVFKNRAIAARGFLATGIPAADAAHGTAVAALLVGDSVGLLPGARLYAANVFRTRGRARETTAEWIAQAFNWLVERRVAIVNLSFGGPRNLLLEAAVERLLATGAAVVAAGGNGGEQAGPVYPAAQRGVIAVSAVDAELKPWRQANRGDYLAFSAPGVDIWSAAPGRDGAYVSGTSYAAPFVTAALAAERLAKPKATWITLQQQLQKKSRDLGAPGKDPVFGWGLVRASACR
jgi:subtilisin family serine protease